MAQVNGLVDRFFEARKMMSSMAGRFGLPGGRPSNRKSSKSRSGKRKKVSSGRGPTQARVQGHARRLPGRPAAGDGRRTGVRPAGRRQPGGFGLDQLPPGFDPSKLKFPKQ